MLAVYKQDKSINNTQRIAFSKKYALIGFALTLLLNTSFSGAVEESSSHIDESKENSGQRKESIVVITNLMTQEESIAVHNLRSIFAMRLRRWGKEDRLEVFVLPDDHPTHSSFTKSILHTFPHNLRRIWDRRAYSGTGQLPNVVSTEEEMIEKVSNTPNSIGYVTKHHYRDSAKVVELER
ncbi:hypothetical protein GCM10025791_21040 [Halioxenophilus aromaticivorans]|uniref:Uncharacterized protein n=1 Tax=Halioxenophilus aromaticivorans TaxID=1306992 RepID=A0AAV3U1Z2_9ALTE